MRNGSGCAPRLGTAMLCGGIVLLCVAFLPAASWLFIIGMTMALEGFYLLRRDCRR